MYKPVMYDTELEILWPMQGTYTLETKRGGVGALNDMYVARVETSRRQTF
jgi:hypothetical protein